MNDPLRASKVATIRLCTKVVEQGAMQRHVIRRERCDECRRTGSDATKVVDRERYSRTRRDPKTPTPEIRFDIHSEIQSQ